MVVLSILGGLLGLLIGSFLNVVAYRIPLDRSIVHPGSACPACGNPVRARDNIPVVSWVLLRGQCRDCGAAISARYPLVEAATAAVFAAVPFIIPDLAAVPAYWWFGAVGITLVLTDLDHKRIPNKILFPGIVGGTVLLAVAAVATGEPGSFLRAIGGGAAYFGFFLALALVARGGFGFGDVKLAFLLGAFMAYQSWGVLAVGVMAAFLLGGVVAIGLLAAGRRSRKDAIPFGPSLIVGAFIAIVWGEQIVDWYVGL